jgi:hypothetical protein
MVTPLWKRGSRRRLSLLSYNTIAMIRIYACASTRLCMTLPHFHPPVPLPATASAEGRQFNGGPSLWERVVTAGEATAPLQA